MNNVEIKAPDWEKAPASGWILIINDDGSVLDKYEITDGEIHLSRHKTVKYQSVRRMHCFDKSKEYRYININGNITQTICTAEEESEMEQDLLFEDYMIVSDRFIPKENGIWKICLVDRYRYGETDTLVLNGYRLVDVCRVE